METVGQYYDKVSLELKIKSALSTVNFYFSASKPHRYISGIAISSREPDSNGLSLLARGVEFNLPTVLLWNHDFMRPLGRVIGIEKRGDELLFRAEIANNNVYWADEIWRHMIAKNVARISTSTTNLRNLPFNSTHTQTRLNEISVLETGADPCAVITKVWESASTIYLDGGPSQTVYWERAA